jgi:hypothetical protein
MKRLNKEMTTGRDKTEGIVKENILCTKETKGVRARTHINSVPSYGYATSCYQARVASEHNYIPRLTSACTYLTRMSVFSTRCRSNY